MAIVLDGLVFGLQLSVLAVGLTLVYGLGGVLNLAHGQLVVVAAMTMATTTALGLGTLPAIAVGVGAAMAVAWLLDATLLRSVYRRSGEQRVLLGLLLTLGVAFAIDGVVISRFPLTVFSVTLPVGSVEVAGVTMRSASLVASLVAAVALLGLGVLLSATRVGLAIRSVIEDEEGAVLCGVDPARVRRVVFVLGGALAGLVAVTQGLVSSVGPAAGGQLTILALIVTVVGGLGRVSGALLAGLVLGVVHAAASYHLGASVTFLVLLMCAIAMVLLRPAGLLGRQARA